MGIVAAAHDDVAGLDGLRPQQPHDVGDRAGVEAGEQRHPRHHAPGHDEVAAVDLLGKRGGDVPTGSAIITIQQDGGRRDQLAERR